MEEARGKLIEKGDKIVSFDPESETTGKEVKLVNLISTAGGEGDVYRVNYEGKEYAMKWFVCNPENPDPDDYVVGRGKYMNVVTLLKMGRPKDHNRQPCLKFIWPLYMVVEDKPADPAAKRFGYLMDLIPEGYYEMKYFLAADADRKKKRFDYPSIRYKAAMNMANLMRLLHLNGLAYQDLNPGNFCMNPKNGDVLVVDNDNVSISGTKSRIKGFPGFIAPEIVRNKVSPDTKTDYYSLAVTYYHLFCYENPMEGSAWADDPVQTLETEEYRNAVKPVFHFDPNNKNNRPNKYWAPNAEKFWKKLPDELQKVFITSFTEGVDHPERRLTEEGWIIALSKVRDRIIRYTDSRTGQKNELIVKPDDSDTLIAGVMNLTIGSRSIALFENKAIYGISLYGDANKYMDLIGAVLRNAENGQLFIENRSNVTWTVCLPKTGQKGQVEPKGTVSVINGLEIEFDGRVVGKIESFK